MATKQDEYNDIVERAETIRDVIDDMANRAGSIDVGRLADEVNQLARAVIMLARLQQRSIK
jgi:hypothetical protein